MATETQRHRDESASVARPTGGAGRSWAEGSPENANDRFLEFVFSDDPSAQHAAFAASCDARSKNLALNAILQEPRVEVDQQTNPLLEDAEIVEQLRFK